MATTSWMPDLASRSASFGSSAAFAAGERMPAWSTMRPVSGGKVSAAATVATKHERDGEERQCPSGRARDRRCASSRPSTHQNFTSGGVCAPSLAANSAIGLLSRKKVFAHSTPGKVRSSVL